MCVHVNVAISSHFLSHARTGPLFLWLCLVLPFLEKADWTTWTHVGIMWGCSWKVFRNCNFWYRMPSCHQESLRKAYYPSFVFIPFGSCLFPVQFKMLAIGFKAQETLRTFSSYVSLQYLEGFDLCVLHEGQGGSDCLQSLALSSLRGAHSSQSSIFFYQIFDTQTSGNINVWSAYAVLLALISLPIWLYDSYVYTVCITFIT